MSRGENDLKFSDLFYQKGEVAKVDWEEVGRRAEGLPAERRDDFVTDVQWAWLKELGESRKLKQGRLETDHHLILSDEVEQPVERFERAFDEITEHVFEYLNLPVFTSGTKHGGKLVVLIFSTSDGFVKHLTLVGQESDGYETSGCETIVHGDHWHYALHGIDDDSMLGSFGRNTAWHLVSSIGEPPLWMRVGALEHITGLITGASYANLSRDDLSQHQAHWNREKLAVFSSPEMLNDPENGYSSQLAAILWDKLDRALDATPADRLALLEKASADDGGEAALNEIFGIGLHDLFQSFLGKL